MSNTDQSTQQEYEEVWLVNLGKEKYQVNEKQIKVLKRAMEEGHRGVIWFDSFAISVPHIQSISLISKTIKNKIETNFDFEVSEEEREKVRKAMTEFRKAFIGTHAVPKKMTKQEINTRRNELLDQAERLEKLN